MIIGPGAFCSNCGSTIIVGDVDLFDGHVCVVDKSRLEKVHTLTPLPTYEVKRVVSSNPRGFLVILRSMVEEMVWAGASYLSTWQWCTEDRIMDRSVGFGDGQITVAYKVIRVWGN